MKWPRKMRRLPPCSSFQMLLGNGWRHQKIPSIFLRTYYTEVWNCIPQSAVSSSQKCHESTWASPFPSLCPPPSPAKLKDCPISLTNTHFFQTSFPPLPPRKKRLGPKYGKRGGGRVEEEEPPSTSSSTRPPSPMSRGIKMKRFLEGRKKGRSLI